MNERSAQPHSSEQSNSSVNNYISNTANPVIVPFVQSTTNGSRQIPGITQPYSGNAYQQQNLNSGGNYGYSSSVPSSITYQTPGVAPTSNNYTMNAARYPLCTQSPAVEGINYPVQAMHGPVFNEQMMYHQAPATYNVVAPRMHPNKTATMQYIPRTVMYYPTASPQIVLHHQQQSVRAATEQIGMVRSSSMNINSTAQMTEKDFSSEMSKLPKQENVAPPLCNTMSTSSNKSEPVNGSQLSVGAISSSSTVSSGTLSEDQTSKGSSKSSPSPDEWTSDFEMDLSQLPAFNFNLEEICEDVLFPEQDDFDDILIDDLTISPKSSLNGGSSDTSAVTQTPPALVKSESDSSCNHQTRSPVFQSNADGVSGPSIGTSFGFQNQSTNDSSSSSAGVHSNFQQFKSDNLQFCSSQVQSENSGNSMATMDNGTVVGMVKTEEQSNQSATLPLDRPVGLASQVPLQQELGNMPESNTILTSTGNVRRRRRPDRPSNVKEACSICGDKASGYHYNALSCEGCKGFFRRSVTNDRKYTCEKSGACNIDIYMRRKCQKCRLERCYGAGMRKECLMSVEQCRSMQVRRKNKSANQSSSSSSVTPIVSSTGHPIPGTTPTVLLAASSAPGHQPGMPPTVDANGMPVFVVQPMMGHAPTAHVPTQTPYRSPGEQGFLAHAGSGATQAPSVNSNGSTSQRVFKLPPSYDCAAELSRCGLSMGDVELVQKLVRDRWSIGMPSPEKTQLLPPWPGRTGDPGLISLPQDRQRQMKFQHMTHVTRICMEGVIQLAKRLHNFSHLDQQHQIRLVKPACIEVLMINSAQYFDVATDRLLMATGHWTTHEQMEDGLLKYGFGTQMWQFVRQLALMNLHDIEFALMTAICILAPDREGLSSECQEMVLKSQEPYLHSLRLFCQVNSPPNSNRLNELLDKLIGLRSISFQHRKYLFGIQLNKSNWEPLPQLLGEIFDQSATSSAADCQIHEIRHLHHNNSTSSAAATSASTTSPKTIIASAQSESASNGGGSVNSTVSNSLFAAPVAANIPQQEVTVGNIAPNSNG